jgi:predicted 3-demethylubiquinone-9 3-methyltransferase (glyoxalase superfamily)
MNNITIRAMNVMDRVEPGKTWDAISLNSDDRLAVHLSDEGLCAWVTVSGDDYNVAWQIVPSEMRRLAKVLNRLADQIES